jgi:hypothetical protein
MGSIIIRATHNSDKIATFIFEDDTKELSTLSIFAATVG